MTEIQKAEDNTKKQKEFGKKQIIKNKNMSIESVIKDLSELVEETAESVRITAVAGKRAMLDSGTPSVIQAEATDQKGEFKLKLLSPKGTTNLGTVLSDTELSAEDLSEINKMNEKGLKGYQSQIN